jgi:hypothetical protein
VLTLTLTDTSQFEFFARSSSVRMPFLAEWPWVLGSYGTSTYSRERARSCDGDSRDMEELSRSFQNIIYFSFFKRQNIQTARSIEK